MRFLSSSKLFLLCLILLSQTIAFGSSVDYEKNSKHLSSSLKAILNDSIPDCDDLVCSNGVEYWNPDICKCMPGIPPSPCSDCYGQNSGTPCDDGDPNTLDDFWEEIEPTEMLYKIEFVITWDSLSPGWPDENAHFSWLGGATHNSNVKFWEEGTLASPGIDQMSINGLTLVLAEEVGAEIDNGNAQQVIQKQQWFCTEGITHSACGDLSFDLMMNKDFPLISLVSMLGPSPDWFIGVESLSVIENDQFIPQIIYELYPYDSGILSDNSVLVDDCCDREPLSVPQENVHLITEESGELIGPNSLGKLVFTAYPNPINCFCMAGETDADGDGYGVSTDCDDDNANINPGTTEIVYNGIDDDCDEATLDDDLDQDGFLLAEDCDDENENVNPDENEIIYNGIDDDCNEATLDDDLDQDGFPIATDCDDENENINPDAVEIPNNNIDEDCDGEDLVSATHELANSSFSIHPNPFNDFLYITSDASVSYNLKVFSIEGRQLLELGNPQFLDLSDLKSGTYILKLQLEESNQYLIERIVKI